MILRLLILSFCLTAESSSGGRTVYVFDNGASGDGYKTTITPDLFGNGTYSLAKHLSQFVEVLKWNGNEDVNVGGERVFAGNGRLVDSWDVVEDEQRLYLVAPDLPFQWPFVRPQFTVQVPHDVLTPADPVTFVTLQSISDSPRVFIARNMFSDEEAQGVITHALTNDDPNNRLAPSTVGSNEDVDVDGSTILRGGGRKASTRTSENAWDHVSEPAKKIIERSFALVRIPHNMSFADGLQVVRYLPGQGYFTHPDYFGSSDDPTREFNFEPWSGGSNRYATVFMYLNNVPEGGHTVFPHAPHPEWMEKLEPPEGALEMFEEDRWERTMIKDLCYDKLHVRPEKGAAALFYSITPSGRTDRLSEHGACPTTGGSVKWGANLWIWNKKRFGAGNPEEEGGESRLLNIHNNLNEHVWITWHGKNSGEVAPHGSFIINSYEKHPFEAHTGSLKGPVVSTYRVTSEKGANGKTWDQSWEINYGDVPSDDSNESAEAARDDGKDEL